MMSRTIFSGMAMSLLASACGASIPVPTQRMADAESAHRSATELGAMNQPAAKLHLRLAEEQIARAKTLVKDGDNKRADYILVRAKADAELALALAREQAALVESQKATETSNASPSSPANQGANK